MTFTARVWEGNGTRLDLGHVPNRKSVALRSGATTLAWLTEPDAWDLARVLDLLVTDPPAGYGTGKFGGTTGNYGSDT